MSKVFKSIVASVLTLAIISMGMFFSAQVQQPTFADAANNTWNGKTPKYVFLFIGDGMTYPQLSAATSYLGNSASEGKVVETQELPFMNFPAVGASTTFDSTSFCPDSASTATSIATGYKTNSGVINMDEQKKISYEAISEKLKKQLGYKVGVVSSVPINHATPAAFYAHQPSRGNYYEIGVELAKSNFDYFGGGDLLARTGKNSDQKDLYDVARENGYTIANTKESILSLTKANEKVLAISPEANGGAMPYEIDRKSGELSLADFTRKGIDVLFNEKGFFMMVEAGKIDWTGHANDAMTSIKDTLALSAAIDEAIKFYNKYPNDTLIIVTGDHETGGMTLGYAGTKYATYLDQLSNQTMSYEAYDVLVADFRKNQTPFATALKDVEKNFGLYTAAAATDKTAKTMILADHELKQLEVAYKLSLIERKERQLTAEDSLLYGGYEPFTVKLTHLLNNKSGIGWTSYSHTGIPTAVFAKGIGASVFNGYYDNTDIFIKLASITNVK